jgi:hypothetical protein
VVVRVRRVIVGDDLCGRSDPRSGCCQRCCQLVDLADPIPRLPDLPPARRRSCCRTARPELSSCERRQCTSDSSLPPKLKVPGRIRIHLSSVDVHTSSAATRNQHQWQASSVFRRRTGHFRSLGTPIQLTAPGRRPACGRILRVGCDFSMTFQSRPVGRSVWLEQCRVGTQVPRCQRSGVSMEVSPNSPRSARSTASETPGGGGSAAGGTSSGA